MLVPRFIIFLSILLGLVLYTGCKIRPFFPRPVWPWAAAGILFLLMWGPFFLFHGKPGLIDSKPFTVLAWTGATVMGLWAFGAWRLGRIYTRMKEKTAVSG